MTKAVAIFCAICGLLIGWAATSAWSLYFGDHKALSVSTVSLGQCQIDRHTYAQWTADWKALYGEQESRLTASEASAAQSLTEATARCSTASKSSYSAGVIAGRALERQSHANIVSGAVAPDVVRDDFQAFWSGSAVSH